MPLMLACSDILAVLCSVTVCVLVRYALGGNFELGVYLRLWPILPLFVTAYAWAGAYKVLVPSPMELKRCTLATTFVFLLLASVTFWSRTAHEYSRLIMFFSCVMTWILVPVLRRRCRELAARSTAWRRPAIIYGSGTLAGTMVRNFHDHLNLGLIPMGLIDDGAGCGEEDCSDIKRYGKEDVPDLAQRYPGAYFLIAKPDLNLGQYQDILKHISRYFRKIVIAPDIFRPASIWASVVDIDGILGLETGQRLLDPLPKFYKRVIDLVFSALGLVALSPLFALLVILIKFDSRGPALYFQERIGRHGKRFRLWKFRTMAADADKVLERYLADNPTLRAEWEAGQKLAEDPRITRVGAFLRRWSIDELPQLVNVLLGEMSLVGPRPIVESEIERYDGRFELYAKVVPGLTGLWQVSGRSALPYEKRIELDVYYIRNWSIWFDLYILTRTPGAVFRCSGAV